VIKDKIQKSGSVDRHDARIGEARAWFYVDHDKGLVDLSSVRVPTKQRGKGYAKKALEYVTSIADELGYSARLAASPLDRKTRTADLVKLYEKFGFKTTGERVNPLGDPWMKREPREKGTTHTVTR